VRSPAGPLFPPVSGGLTPIVLVYYSARTVSVELVASP
jgi:hypothetical protein